MLPLSLFSTAKAAEVTPIGTIQTNQDPSSILGSVLGQVIFVLSWVAGFVAVAYLIYNGIQYITSATNPDKVKSARAGIINAIIGIAVITAAYWIITTALRLGGLVSSGTPVS